MSLFVVCIVRGAAEGVRVDERNCAFYVNSQRVEFILRRMLRLVAWELMNRAHPNYQVVGVNPIALEDTRPGTSVPTR